MRNLLLFGLAGSLLVALAVLAGGFDVTHGQSQIDNVSVDMDHSGNDATTADATPETCARIQENDAQDYDEDDVDIVFIDVIVGPDGIPADRPISGIGFDLAFPDTAVQVVDVVAVDHDFLLGSGGSPQYIPFDESKPDTTSPYAEGVTDFSTYYESGPGVLIRVGLESVTTDADVGTVEVLNNDNYLILDDYNEIIPATNINSATVAVNQPCPTVNTPPVITPSVPDLNTPEDTVLNYDLTPHETDAEDTGTALDWSISGVDTALFSADIDLDTDVLTITPVGDASGSDVVTLTLTDSGALTDTQDITVNVNAVNDPPVCTGAAVTTDEDTTSASFSLNCTDAEGDPMTCFVVDPPPPDKGTVNITDCDTVTYTPDPDENGADSFTYKANDGTEDSAEATGDVTITPVNDAPVCTGAAVTTDEDTTSASFSLNCTDVDGDPMTCFVVDPPPPDKGTVNITDCDTVTYTPDPDENGADSFTYKANDGTEDSAEATGDVTINAMNDAPVCTGAAVTTDEDTTSAPFSLNCTDAEGDPMTCFVVDPPPPDKGTVNITDCDTVTYEPDPDENGADSFTYKANDGIEDSAEATGDVTITPVNDEPVCAGTDQTTVQDTPVTFPLPCTDVDGDLLTCSLVDPASDGTAEVGPDCDSSATYTPDPGFFGEDSFTYRAYDGTAYSNVATADITVLFALDTDGDGVYDHDDLCPDTVAGPVDENGCSDAQVDGDGDGICDPGAPSVGPSNCQLDPPDNCPVDYNPEDYDGDGPDGEDPVDGLDNDGDGLVDEDHEIGQDDVDDDGLGDACDDDDDNDGYPDIIDNCDTVPNDQEDFDQDGEGDACDDYDQDGVVDAIDNCLMVENEDQLNTDGDARGDACDADDDDDDVIDILDNCPLTVNPDQDDIDEDGHGNVCDNCPDDNNPGQEDNDGDLLGNPCDNCADNYNPGQEDVDFDDVGDLCDNCLTTPNTDQEDIDTDTVGDACDNCPSDWNSDQRDMDVDGVGNHCDDDTDGDSDLNVTDPDDDADLNADVDEVACGADPLHDLKSPERVGNGLDDDGDMATDEVQAPVPGFDCDGDGFDDDVEAVLTWPPTAGSSPETGTQCDNFIDDDPGDDPDEPWAAGGGTNDGIVNDGCPNPVAGNTYNGTGHQERCADTLAHSNEADDQWPGEFNDNGLLNLQDVNTFAWPTRHFGQPVANHQRWNLVPALGAVINLQDVNAIGYPLAPPMFDGEKAFGNTTFGMPGQCPAD